jgi:hypothetical protein
MNTNDETSIFSQTDLISSYSRAQAIADGILVEAGPMAQEAGWKIPVALTAVAWTDCVEWTEGDSKRKHCGQDEAGRLWDVLWMGMIAAKRHMARCEAQPDADPSRCRMMVYRVPRKGRGIVPRLTELKIIIDGGDDGLPVATILLPDED